MGEISPLAKFGWGMLIAATLYVCYFSHLGAFGFVGPDEPRYAWISRAMLESGDWVTPRLYGKPWFEKPVLFYWGAGLSFKMFGVSEAAARLPSALSALFATLAMAWLALRMYGAETARLVFLMLPTTIGMIGFSHAAAPDMLFSGTLAIAMAAAAVVVGITRAESLLRKTQVAALAAFGFFLGAATLAKGPAAIILAGGGTLLWAAISKRWRDAIRLAHPIALAAFCIAVLPWYVLCALRNPDFLRVFIFEHNFQRYLTPEFRHVQPFWFFIPVLLLGLLPWSAVLLSAARDGISSWKQGRIGVSRGLFPMCWAVFTIVFFSLSKSKLPGYILPAVPPLMLAAASAVSQRLEKRAVGSRWISVAIGLTSAGMGCTAFAFRSRIPFAADTFPPRPFALAILMLVLGGVAAVLLGFRKLHVAALSAVVLSVVGTMALAFTGNAQRALDNGISVGPATKTYPGGRAYTYKLQRSYQYGLNFYLRSEVPEWSPDGGQPGWVFAQRGQIGELQGLGLKCPAYDVYQAVVVCEDPGSAARKPVGRKAQ